MSDSLGELEGYNLIKFPIEKGIWGRRISPILHRIFSLNVATM
jgi:hypothetical protein